MTSDKFPVPSETVEAGLLHACTTMEQWLELNVFDEEDFTSHREIYRFFKSHLSQYGLLPTQSQISTRFTWSPPIGEFRYWLEEMKKYSLARKIEAAVLEGYQGIGKPEEALSLLLTKLSLIRSQHSKHVKATDAEALVRLEKFDYRTEEIFKKQQMLGIRTGHKVIDESMMGWMPGNLIGCYARPGIGKTWWLMWQGIQAWMEGYTVLAISPEMPVNQLNLRIDCVAGSALGHQIEYNKLRNGDPEVRNEYELITNILAQTSRWWTYDSSEGERFGLGEVLARINQHSPDLVLIDGLSLMRPETRGQTWEQVKDLSYGLKHLATVKNVPIIVTHQAVNSGRGRRGFGDEEGRSTASNDEFHMPSLNDAAYGDAFVQACSDVITMCAEPTSSHVIWYSIRKHRERGWTKPLETRYAMAVDFAYGKIIDLSQFGYNPAIVGQETQKVIGHL